MDQDTSATTQVLRLDCAIARRVLLVDDDELVLAHLSDLVTAAGFEVHTAGDGTAALAFLERNFVPLVITDRNMPAMDGLQLCRAIREKTWPGYVYIILLTVHDGEADILAGLDAGADDYLSKRTSAPHVLARLRTAQRILTLETALKAELEEKRRQSMTDALTGANNRRYFERHLNRDFKGARRRASSLSLIMLDIDHFKRINDSMGHAAGDEVLKELVRRIGECLPRATDWFARIGGEEFAIVLGDTSLLGAVVVAERIRHTIAATAMTTGSGTLQVTASLGVTDCLPGGIEDTVTLKSLISDLDVAMYKSKQSGRNRVTMSQSSAAAAAPIEAALETSMPLRAPDASPPLRSVLYIDDEPDIRLIVQIALSLNAGLAVHTGESGEQALRLVRQLKPDLLLLDVMMPGLDGPATLMRLRADPTIAHTPVAFITAKATPEEVSRLRAMGASGVIAKPFDPIRLSEQVQSLWQKLGGDGPQMGKAADVRALRERVAALAGNFLTRTKAQALTMHALSARLKAGDSTAVAPLHELAHKIHGSGATFDFPLVSEWAQQIEELSHTLLRSRASSDGAADAVVGQRIAECVQQLTLAVKIAAAGSRASAADDPVAVIAPDL